MMPGASQDFPCHIHYWQLRFLLNLFNSNELYFGRLATAFDNGRLIFINDYFASRANYL